MALAPPRIERFSKPNRILNPKGDLRDSLKLKSLNLFRYGLGPGEISQRLGITRGLAQKLLLEQGIDLKAVYAYRLALNRDEERQIDKTDPRFNVHSTIDDVINNRPTLDGKEVNLAEWWQNLPYLKGPGNFRFKAISAQRRRLIIQMLQDPTISQSEVTRKLNALGYKISYEAVSQTKDNFMQDRQRASQYILDKAEPKALELTKRGDLTRDEICQLVGLNTNQLDSILERNKISIKEIKKQFRSAEQEKRRQYLIGLRITPTKDKVRLSIDQMRTNYLYFARIHKFYPEEYRGFLDRPIAQIIPNIERLNRFGVNWKEYPLNLLISNSEEYLEKQIAILNSVGANANLHILLLNQMEETYANYKLDKYVHIRDAIKALRSPTNFDLLFSYSTKLTAYLARQMVANFPDSLIKDIARNEFTNVLYNCKYPERDPAAILTLLSIAIKRRIIFEKGSRRAQNVHSQEYRLSDNPKGDIFDQREIERERLELDELKDM